MKRKGVLGFHKRRCKRKERATVNGVRDWGRTLELGKIKRMHMRGEEIFMWFWENGPKL